MNRGDIVRILHGTSVRGEEKPVSTKALGLPGSARVRELANLDGFFSIYCVESSASTFPFADLRGALEKSGTDALALVGRDGEDTVVLHRKADSPREQGAGR
jgi:hypothetical protein